MEDLASKSGIAAQTSYSYSTKKVNVFTQHERYGDDFQMDTAFYNRTGITTGWLHADLSFYPDKEKHPWLKRAAPYIFTEYGRDQITIRRARF